MHLHARGITKRFGHNTALAGVDLDIAPGEVVAILGENGAGKSTLVRILTGAHQPDEGQLIIDNEPVAFRDTRHSMQVGIHAIYQEIRHNLCPQLSVAENIFMRDGNRFGRVLVNKSLMRRSAEQLLTSIGTDLNPATRVMNLSVSEQQMVELARVIASRCELLVLDEPTAALEQQETERLFAQIRRLKAEGVSIVYVSHRLEEVFALADRLIVLRDGRVSTEGPTSSFTEEQVVRAMVGRPIDSFYPKERNTQDTVVMTIEGLSSSGEFQDIDLDLHAGEIVGIGGAMGSGRGPLLRTLFGQRPIQNGSVRLSGQRLRLGSPRAAIRAGIGYISEDRQRDGLCLSRSVSDNVTLASADRYRGALGLMRRRTEHDAARSIIEELNIRTESVRTEVGQLSGGNQQKVLFGKWLLREPKVLLLEEPTRGVDVGAKVEIYRHLNRLTAAGMAVILVSSDLPELCEMSDRVVVMRAGRIVASLVGDQIRQENVLTYALSDAA